MPAVCWLRCFCWRWLQRSPCLCWLRFPPIWALPLGLPALVFWWGLLFSAPACRLQTAAVPKTKRSEEHTSELQSLMRISYAVFCLKKKKLKQPRTTKQKEINITLPTILTNHVSRYDLQHFHFVSTL